MTPSYLAGASRSRIEQIGRLLDWTAQLRADATAMPWAEPPDQPTAFDRRDAEEAEEFAEWLTAHDRNETR